MKRHTNSEVSDLNQRTDIAYEEIERVKSEDVFISETKQYHNIVVRHIQVLKKSEQLNKMPGDYITIDISGLNDQKERKDTAEVLKECLIKLFPNRNQKVLIVGLGNSEVTADALGPLTASKLYVTSHLFRMNKKEMIEGCRDVSVLIPRVMGQTGIETADCIRAVSSLIQPDFVIVIDALATSSIERLNRVIQISNTGIQPGSGIGNHRLAIDEESLKVPVLALGVATVVSVEALLEQFFNRINDIDFSEAKKVFEENEYLKMVVTPKEMDEDMEHLAQILSDGLNGALHQRVSSF